MRHLLLVAVLATPVASAEGTYTRPENVEASQGFPAAGELPSAFEPTLRGDGPETLQRSDATSAPANAKSEPPGHHQDHKGSHQ